MKKATLLTAVAILLAGVSLALAGQAPPPAARFFQWRPFLAPFHSVVLHFPIGFLTLAGILEVYRVFSSSLDVRRISILVMWLGLITGIVSAAFGLMRAGTGGYESSALELHRVYGIAVPVITAVAMVIQWIAYKKESSKGWRFTYRASLVGTLGLVMVAGHYGGNLTHGSKYLVENAPEFVRDLLEPEPEAAPAQNPETLDANQRQYVEKVKPLLEAKCYQCHGPEKQKGGYRLDQPDVALKGGESGKTAIKPGDPMESHLVRLILLPPQNDDVMPPAGKEPLSSDEVMTLLDWIRNGAKFPLNTSGPARTNSPATTNAPAAAKRE